MVRLAGVAGVPLEGRTYRELDLMARARLWHEYQQTGLIAATVFNGLRSEKTPARQVEQYLPAWLKEDREDVVIKVPLTVLRDVFVRG